jgi:Ca2+-binding RTX toxin-like protein
VEDVKGGSGNDRIAGTGAENHLNGGAGDDMVAGGRGSDELTGGTGNDFISDRDGSVDKISCGPGADRVLADLTDAVSADCESVNDADTPDLTISRRAVRMTPSGIVSVLLACPADEVRCMGTLRLDTAKKVTVSRKRKVKLGTRRFNIKGGHRKRVKVKTKRRNRRLVIRLKTVGVRGTAGVKDIAGNRKTVRGTFTLKRPKRKRR